jgi:hypothetical protein
MNDQMATTSTTASDDVCPSCGRPYSLTIETTVCDDWRELFAGPPHTLFARHARVCADHESVDTDTPNKRKVIELYLHKPKHLEHGHDSGDLLTTRPTDDPSR